MRDIGTMGELFFENLCAQSGIACNGSKIDRTGWDHIIEFEFQNEEGIHESPICCKVQVKSTDSLGKNNQIKLSNLRRMCTEQMPAFYVFINFNNTNVAQDIFLVHVDKEFIANVFEKIQSINRNTTLESLNKKKMYVEYDIDHKLEENTGQCLKDSILSFVGNNYAKYIENKNKIIKSVGFENESGSFTFVTEDDVQLEQLVDLSLGLIDKVKIKNFRGVSSRFGIPDANPFTEGDNGILSMPNPEPSKVGKISFRDSRESAWFSFDANMYLSPFNEFVGHRFKKFRIRGEFFDIVFSGDNTFFKYDFGHGVRLSIAEFIYALKILNWLSYEKKTIYYRFDFGGGISGEYRLRGEGADQRFDVNRALDVLESSQYIINEVGTNEQVKISLFEIFENKSPIMFMQKLFACKPEEFDFSVDIDGLSETTIKSAIINYAQAVIGTHYIGVVFTFFGELNNQSDGSFKLSATEKKIEQIIFEPIEREISRSKIENICIEMKQNYKSHLLVLTPFDKEFNTI